MARRAGGRFGGTHWSAPLAITTVFGSIVLGIILSSSAGAASTDDLSAQVLAQVPVPGLVAAAPGPTNGPIGPSNIGLFGGEGGAIEQHIASGDMTGYVRLFAANPPNGQAVVIAAIWVKDPNDIPGFLAGVEGSATGPRFSVPGIVDAIGFQTTSTTATGVPSQNYVVAFSRGNLAFVTLVGSVNGSLGKSSAVSVASAQAAAVPGAPVAAGSVSSTSTAYRAGEIFGAVLIAVAVFGAMAVVIRKSVGSKQRVTPAAVPAAWFPPNTTNQSLQVGWHQTGQSFNEQFYWDGQAWTATRRWTAGVGWSEIPLSRTTQ